MTGPGADVSVQPGYQGIGPKPGLIKPDHSASPDNSWWSEGRGPDPRWLIPGVWPWGHLPLMTGQPKVGKTMMVIDLVASLLIPGRKFLNHFEPSSLTPDDRSRGIVLINAETPTDAMVHELMIATEEDPSSRQWLEPVHLAQRGGAATFDLTEPSLFDQWAHNLTLCNYCDRSDDWTPSVVIVDGLTAILQAAGKGVEHYGLWYAKFRLLMTELRVPNALVVGHSTLTGNHSMGGTEALAGPDGLWTYSSDNVDNPRAARRFSVTPRLGGQVVPSLRVERDESGRLVVPNGAGSQSASSETAAAVADLQDVGAKAESEVRTKLREAGAVGLRRTQVTGWGSWGKVLREALARLVASGEVIERPEGQGSRCWLAEAVPS